MLIAHLPSGYIIAKILYKKIKFFPYSWRWFLFICLTGAIAPDFDIIYNHFLDQSNINHRFYWSHHPIIWFGLLFIMSLLLKFYVKIYPFIFYSVVFTFCACIHLLLDSVAGVILCGAPFSYQSYSLVTIPATFSHWWLNLILHWTFLLEIFITGWAVCLWLKERKKTALQN